MNFLLILSYILAAGGLGLLLATVVLWVDYFYYQSRFFRRLVQPYVWLIIIGTTVGSVALSLVYSEYFGFIPCSLCWLQRIALYPQALFAIMAFKTKESIYFPLYSMTLSGFGLLVAVYHYIYQLKPKEETVAGMVMPCLADGSADCGVRVIDVFGFITFPLLSAITFTFLIVVYLHLRRSKLL